MGCFQAPYVPFRKMAAKACLLFRPGAEVGFRLGRLEDLSLSTQHSYSREMRESIHRVFGL